MQKESGAIPAKEADMIWYIGTRPLTGQDKLNANLADIGEAEAGHLTPEELEEAADCAWMLIELDPHSLGV